LAATSQMSRDSGGNCDWPTMGLAFSSRRL
jgi:hypothetical protein